MWAKEKDEEIYPRLRKVETNTARLQEQNKGQDAWSGKVWAMIMIFITVAFNALSWLLRG